MSWDDPDPIEEGGAGAPTLPENRVVASGLALLLGIGSILMGYFPLSHFAFIVYHYVFVHDPRAPTGGSWRSLLFGVTSPWLVAGFLGWLAVSWALGYAGWRIARAQRRPGRVDSLASAAARFSALGLAGCGVNLAILAGMLAYRWTR